MQVEIDESGKFEQQSRPSVLAMGGDVNYSVLISAKQKRILHQLIEHVERSRQRSGKKKRAPARVKVRCYSILLYFLLCDVIQRLTHISVDIDYAGYTRDIEAYTLYLLRRDGLKIENNLINFVYVGKKSPAHSVAINTYRGKQKANKILTADDVISKY